MESREILYRGDLVGMFLSSVRVPSPSLNLADGGRTQSPWVLTYLRVVRPD